MKKIKRTLAIVLVIAFSLPQMACFGEFALTRKVYEFNKVMDEGEIIGRFVNNLVFIGLNIIPVYSIATFVDFIILNLIEFWSGSNPLAMAEGEMEEQFLTKNGVDYKLVAEKNKFSVYQIEGNHETLVSVASFNPISSEWAISENNEEIAIAVDMVNDNKATFYYNHIPLTVTTEMVSAFAKR